MSFRLSYFLSEQIQMIHPADYRYGSKNNNSSLIAMSLETVATRNQLPSPLRQCRICLETYAENENKKMISPCRCSGSVKFVHEECLKSWVHSSLSSKSKREQVQMIKSGISCEMCKHPIKFEIDGKYRCREGEQIGKVLCKKIPLVVILFVLIAVAISGISFAAYSIGAHGLSFNKKDGTSFQVILAVAGIFLMMLFFSVGIYTCISEFFLEQKFQISQLILVPISQMSRQGSFGIQIEEID